MTKPHFDTLPAMTIEQRVNFCPTGRGLPQRARVGGSWRKRS
jgi:hypothetical protein